MPGEKVRRTLMNAVILVVLGLLALAAAKNLPTLAVLGIVALVATVLRHQAAGAAARLVSLGEGRVDGMDAWATPSADARRLMKRSLKLALQRTELASCFPGRGL